MSKKSRRRNKKILAALALAGGAAMMGRGAKGNVSKTAAMEDINIAPPLVDAADAGTAFQKPPVIRKDVMPAPKRKVWTGNQTGYGKMFYTPRYKHGGKVTGVAKRGFGRALMKGKK